MKSAVLVNGNLGLRCLLNDLLSKRKIKIENVECCEGSVLILHANWGAKLFEKSRGRVL
jgi:hypothetical protein